MGRVMNDAELCLYAWGRWQRGHGTLDISSVSIIGRLMIEGCGASHATIAVLPTMSRSVELTEQCVLTMPKPIQRAVKHRYIGEESDEVASRKLRCTVDQFGQRINQAVGILSNYLTEN